MKHVIKTFPSGFVPLFFAVAISLPAGGGARGSDYATIASPPAPGPVGFLMHTNYHGWTNAILVSNGRVEAVIVPEIARVMQFRFAGEEEGPFWGNRSLDGRKPVAILHTAPPAGRDAPAAEAAPTPTNEWSDLGGDIVWPAPRSSWPNLLARDWPPPRAFDSMPWEARIEGFTVTLVSPVDPEIGVRVWRRIELALEDPVMSVTTTFEKVSGIPMELSVWVVTQLKEPEALIVALPRFERFADSYLSLSSEPPPELTIRDGLLTLGRDPKAAHKIGTDANAVFWLGENTVLRIDSPRHLFERYPDEGSSAELYTSPDPLPYVRVEILGPLKKMIAGNRMSRASTYTLLRRSEFDPELEVRMLLTR